jgi:hypothetical protein
MNAGVDQRFEVVIREWPKVANYRHILVLLSACDTAIEACVIESSAVQTVTTRGGLN